MDTRPKVDFKALKAVSLEQAVQFLQLPHVWEKGAMRLPCPACGEDSRGRALAVHPTEGFSCWHGSSGKKPKASGTDAVALVAHVRDITQYEAGRLLEEHFLGRKHDAPSAPRAPSPAKAEPDGRREPLQPLDYLEHSHPVADLLGLSAATLEALGGGFAPKGTMSGRLLLPLRMQDGSLVGYLGIATNEEQAPLLAFPKNLEERCTSLKPQPAEKPAGAPNDLRKLFRVVA